MTNYKVNVSEYDMDGEDITGLPSRLSIDAPDNITDSNEIEEYLSDKISDITGFCHLGFTYEK